MREAKIISTEEPAVNRYESLVSLYDRVSSIAHLTEALAGCNNMIDPSALDLLVEALKQTKADIKGLHGAFFGEALA